MKKRKKVTKKKHQKNKILWIIITAIVTTCISLIVVNNLFKPEYYNSSRNGRVCSAGKYLQSTLFSTSCRSCTKGYYCPGDDKRYACSKTVTTASEGRTSSRDCNVCKDSKKWFNGTNCVSCTAPYYCKDGQRHLCEKGKTITVNGATSSSQCVKVNCKTSEYINSSGRCEICPKDHYCDGTSATKCRNGRITSSTGNTKKSACVCKSGTYSDKNGIYCIVCEQGKYCVNGKMTACSIGTYQDKTGQSSCNKCTGGKTTTKTGSKSSSDCVCPNGSKLVNGKCISCAAGTYLSGSQCVNCKAGNYCKNNESYKCPSGYTSGAKAKSINSCYQIIGAGQGIANGKVAYCPSGSYSLRRMVFYGTNDYCTPCAKGYYQDKAGQTSCIKCPNGKTTAKTGSNNRNLCK